MEQHSLNCLIVCRNLLRDDIVQNLMRLSQENATSAEPLAGALVEKAETLGLSGNLVASYLVYLIARGENTAATVSQRYAGQIGTSLKTAFTSDMELLFPLLHILPSHYLKHRLLDNYEPTKERMADAFTMLTAQTAQAKTAEELAAVFLSYYRTYGYGDIADYKAFRWDEKKGLTGIRHFDSMILDDLVGYERQKEMLVANTEAFVRGKPANNVLLAGARGTGKSSGVKALANQYFAQGLRLLELSKPQLIYLPTMMETLRVYGSKKFIIFLDDLSFEDVEKEYKYLKSAIEGGVEGKPPNVLIYATSNRRHLIKETWKDRGEPSDELHRNDSVNETISLSDRFGLTILYLAPTQNEYLEIIDCLLKKEGVHLDPEELRILALRWEITHSGRSGRVAKQFVDHYLGSN